MNRERWRRIESIFQAAVERPPALRPAVLDEACAGDTTLRAEVEALLAQHERETSFLEQPMVRLAQAAGDDAAAYSPGPVLNAERVGPYRIVREIGAGGMGVVYLAMHEGPGFERAVAVKVIRRGMDTEDVLRRFQLERRILAALKHPNVARLLDAGATPDGRPYFVMEFVEGVPIDVYCERNQLATPQRLKLFQTVCDAVQHAHGNLIVHRDIKPGNILVGENGEPVLLDFGIGKLLDTLDTPGSSDPTRTGHRAFTPQYASPEQVRGEPVSTATDVYGLGMLLYRLLTGRGALAEASTSGEPEFEKAVLEMEPPRPSSFGRRELAGDLDNIVLKAIRKEPERRYVSAGALSDDIQRHLDGLPVHARADTIRYRAGKFVRRHKLAIGAAAVVFLSLIGATAYSTAQARAVARERDKALEVQNFLLEMFGASGRAGADTVSVRQLLDGQTALIPVAYAENPELRSQMLMVVAEGYDRLGLFPQAETLAGEALAIRRATLSATHPDIAASVSLLGWIQHERDKSKEGEVLLREALALWARSTPRNPAGEARTLNDLGVVREHAGKYDEAGELYRRALAIRRRELGDSARGVAITASNLSAVLANKGDTKGALAMAETALVVMRKAVGPDHQRSTIVQGNIASMRAQLGDFAGAEAEYRDVLARQTRVLGAQHPVTVTTESFMCAVMRGPNRQPEIEACLKASLANLEKAFGPEHTRVASGLARLGSAYSQRRQFAEARPLIERALAIHRKLRGEVHRDVAVALTALADLHGNARDWAAAERVNRQALDIFERTMGKQHVETGAAQSRLAGTVLRQGRGPEAYSLYRSAHATLAGGGLPAASSTMRQLRLRMAQAALAVQKYGEADSLLKVNAASDSSATPGQKAMRDSIVAALSARKKS